MIINSVRNTVLAVCNKNNYGYISPSDFNLFAKQAQLDMFEDYFYQYNYQINKVNAHSTGSSYADIAENLLEVIDSFSKFELLVNAAANQYTLPADFYYINRLLYNSTLDVEKVSESKLHNLLNSLLTAPTTEYPAYVVRGNTAFLFPVTITGGVISCQYIRYPLDPKWGYVTLQNGEPMFNAGTSIDFELPLSDEPMLVNKILQYAGLSIREAAVYQTMSQAEINEYNEER
jgi:hypothetical protein|tara:strand:+ start:3330 stop:4025 length:696 start_codon:yes stop_codon:yes gene_type:complete